MTFEEWWNNCTKNLMLMPPDALAKEAWDDSIKNRDKCKFNDCTIGLVMYKIPSCCAYYFTVKSANKFKYCPYCGGEIEL